MPALGEDGGPVRPARLAPCTAARDDACMLMHWRTAGRRRPLPWVMTVMAGVMAACGAVAADDWTDEAERLARVLRLQPSMTIAEIGAGRGELTVEMARRVPQGRVYSTEIDRARLGDIERRVEEAGLPHVTVLEAGERDSNLPDGCCDAVFMREVYHHFGDAEHTTRTLHRALKPGGLLAVIDYPERGALFGGDCHCIAKDALIAQVTALGFEVVADEDRWAGIRYLVVFRKR